MKEINETQKQSFEVGEIKMKIGTFQLACNHDEV